MDASLQCMLNENSIDYVAKFAELANHINQNDTTQDVPIKAETGSFSYDDIEGNMLLKSSGDSNGLREGMMLSEEGNNVQKVEGS